MRSRIVAGLKKHLHSGVESLLALLQAEVVAISLLSSPGVDLFETHAVEDDMHGAHTEESDEHHSHPEQNHDDHEDHHTLAHAHQLSREQMDEELSNDTYVMSSYEVSHL